MFVKQTHNEVVLWVGQPDCQAAHRQLLDALVQAKTAFLPEGTKLTERRKGNIGEFASLVVGRANDFANWKVIAANAHDPLSDISHPSVDLTWFSFGATNTEDLVVVQEVKTTGDSKLSYADKLIVDYGKLFGTDLQFTLQTRLNVAANAMEGLGFARDLCCRARELAGVSADTSPGVALLPTLVHEREGADPMSKLSVVRTTIISTQGWTPAAVSCWSITLQNLESRISRLTWGKP